jgi:predicted Zn-dependent peptidase
MSPATSAPTPARARERKPQPVPALTRPRKQRLPSVDERTLPTGLRVVAVRRSNVPLVHLRLRVPNGIRRDADLARNEVLARSLMLGAGARTQSELAEALQGIGGGLRVDDGADGVAISGEALRSSLSDLLGLLADVLTEPAYLAGAVEREAARFADQVRRALSQPGVVADEAWLARRYPGHPYRRSFASPEELDEVSARGLRASHRRRIVPRGSLLVLVGDLTPGRALDQVERALAGWDFDGAATQVPRVPPQPRGPLLLVDRPGAVQSNLRLGGAAPRRTDPTYPAGQVANGVFGGYFSSRLTMNIREDKGYTYSPHSGIRHSRADSRVLTSADVATEVTAPALVEVLYELGRIASLAPGPEEVESTVQYLTGTLALATSTQAGLAETLADILSDGMGVDWLQEYPARLAAVTPDDVREAAARMLAPEALVKVVVGDAAVVGDSLAMRAVVERAR